MLQKIVLSEILLIFLTMYFFDQTNCIRTNKMLSCLLWGESFGYNNFNINFYYSKRQHEPERVTPEKIVSGRIDIDLTKRTVVIVHGLAPSDYRNMMYNLGTAFLEWDDVNVIYVDWEEGCASPLHYRQAARNTEYTAIKIRDFLQYSIKGLNGTKKSKKYWGPLHFIGVSLGAHVVGQAAELLKIGSQPLFVYRVTGLDPAEPCFNILDSPLRIRKSNAQYVDIIHTDVARSHNTGLGLFEPIGHVDFYVNGGSSQPGCSWRTKRGLNLIRVGYHIIAQSGRCHHLRSIELFTQTLKKAASKQCKFWAHPWKLEQLRSNTPPRGFKTRANTSIEMGINAELYHRHGVFYVATTGKPPFCKP